MIYPQVSPALKQIWRSKTTLQFGVSPEIATIVDGLNSQLYHLLQQCNGEKTLDDLVDQWVEQGLDRRELYQLIFSLIEHKIVVPRTRSQPKTSRLSVQQRQRFEPDLRALILHGDSPDQIISARARARITVHATSRLGVPLAVMLAANGIGHLRIIIDGTVSAADIMPGGFETGQEYQPRFQSVCQLLRQVAPDTHVTSRATSAGTHFAIFADYPQTDRAAIAGAMDAQTPYLPVWIRDTAVIAGPLVLPGASSCLHCVDLHRTDRDAEWALVAAQLAHSPNSIEPATISVITQAVATIAHGVLRFIDGGISELINYSYEFSHSSIHPQRRRWLMHPECPCGHKPVE